MVVWVECLPADKPWDVALAKRRSSGVAARSCARVYARVLVPTILDIHACMNTGGGAAYALETTLRFHRTSQFCKWEEDRSIHKLCMGRWIMLRFYLRPTPYHLF